MTTPSKYFYRIQHKDSLVGPFNHVTKEFRVNGQWYTTLAQAIQHGLDVDVFGFNTETRPCPKEDGLRVHVRESRDADSRFGFKTLKKVREWFTENKEVYDLLERYGFELARYKVKERFDSDFQSVAYLEGLKEKEVLPFSRLTS